MTTNSAMSNPTTPRMSERRTSLIGAALVVIGPISLALYTPAMPQIVEAFGTSAAAVKMTISVYFAGFALSQLVCGPFSDAFGRKPVTFAFMGIYAVASLLAMISFNIEMLIGARFLQGVGAAVGVAVSRAMVRDQFTREESARIMNLIGIILSVGPALAPTLGGIIMELAGWHAIFIMMFASGITLCLIVLYFMAETAPNRDPSRASPAGLVQSYMSLLRSRYFLLAALTMAGASGALYTQATVLPFILMDLIGLTPSQFGIGMLAQSGMFFFGTVSVYFLMKRMHSSRLVPLGLFFIGLGSLSLMILPNFLPLSFLIIMGPSGLFVYGMPFVFPSISTASLARFPHMAGTASSLLGFCQMGSGLLGGTLSALLGDPILAISLVIPTMGFISIVAWLFWRRMPENAVDQSIPV